MQEFDIGSIYDYVAHLALEQLPLILLVAWLASPPQNAPPSPMEATATLTLSSSPAGARRSPARPTVASLHLRRVPTLSFHLRGAQGPVAFRALSSPFPVRSEHLQLPSFFPLRTISSLFLFDRMVFLPCYGLGRPQGCRRRRRGSGMVVRAEMFGQLTTGLESAWNKLRGVGEFASYSLPI